MNGTASSFGSPENFLLSERVNTPPAEPDWIIPNLWGARTMALFTGAGGEGKTHLTLQILAAIASGGEIEGELFNTPLKQRHVVFITQEDEAEFLKDELFKQHPELKTRTDITNKIRIVSTAITGQNIYLTEPATHQNVFSQIPEGAVFALDSWSTFLSSNENDNISILKNEITALRQIMKQRKATPLILHHRPKLNAQTGLQSTYRGASALPNNCRFHMMLEKDITRGGSKLSFEKVSRGSKPPPLNLVFNEENCLFVPSSSDHYLTVFKSGERLKTSEVIERLGKDREDENDRKHVLNALEYRRKKGLLKKVKEGSRGSDAEWSRPEVRIQ